MPGVDGFKVFVGGLPPDCATETLREYFEQFGVLVDCVVMMDRDTGRTRGFGFVTYEAPEPVDMIMSMHADHKICDKWVDCKRATAEGSKGAPGKGGGKGGGYAGGGGGGGFGGGCMGGGMAGGMNQSRPGDWNCPSCGANVFASKDSCFKCGATRAGGGMAGGCGGGYAAGYGGGKGVYASSSAGYAGDAYGGGMNPYLQTSPYGGKGYGGAGAYGGGGYGGAGYGAFGGGKGYSPY